MRPCTTTALALMLTLLIASTARADVVVLNTGAKIEGRIIEESESQITIETSFGKATFRRDQIRTIQKSSWTPPVRENAADRARAEYTERLGEIGLDDALAIAKLSRWCKDQGLAEEAAETEAMALAIAPENEDVRRALGHIQDRERGWLTPEEHWQAKGFVQHEGEWVTPAERTRRISADLAKQAHEKRRELQVRARAEVENHARDLPSAAEEKRAQIVKDLQALIARYATEGKPFLQGMSALDTELAAVVDDLAAREFSRARDRAVAVMESCGSVYRWEEGAAIALEITALKSSLAANEIAPTKRERQTLQDLNQMRLQMGIGPLAFDSKLYAAAAGHSLEMIQEGFVAHESPTAGQEDADARAHQHGARGQIGENIYYGGLTATQALRAWGNSLGHAENLFDAGWHRVGICAVGRHWTQNFSE